ncbi:MAG: LysR family transcriptional regulator [Bdellovibrionaceae bacterium]|nr:LysR family transcriptional regulator [Pseudobdellovibrionaceae bacterium]
MSLSSLQLDAFLAVCRERSFSKAARRLSLTQSALSQRVTALEGQLEQSLLIRDREGVRLTDAGERLLRYCLAREVLETEALHSLGAEAALAGSVRVAGYSSIVRSVLMPALAPLLRSHPEVRVELLSREMADLPEMLHRGETDYVVLDHVWQRAGVESVDLGEEKNVLIESTRYSERSTFFLDHDADDATTERLLRSRSDQLDPSRRSYLDDVYGVLDGVALGLGRAVVSSHLIPDGLPVKRVHGYGVLKNPVVLHFLAQPYYSELHQQVLACLEIGCKSRLAEKK